MYRILIIILLLDAIVLMAAVLLQSGKGGGLAASFGGGSSGDALFGARQAGNLLTKVTWWSAGIFLGIAFIMQVFSSRVAGPTSVLDQSFTPAKTAPSPTSPSQQPVTGAPSVLTQPAPTNPAPPTPPAAGGKRPDTKKQP